MPTGLANLGTLAPTAVRADVFSGTVMVPITTVPGASLLSEVTHFGLTPVDFQKQRIVRPRPFIKAPPIKMPEGSDSLDSRLLGREQALSWLIAFTNGMHRTAFPGWQIARSQPRAYPAEYVEQLVADGISRELAELYQYVGRATFVKSDAKNGDHQIISEMDLDEKTARLTVVHGRLDVALYGVTMGVDAEGVTQEGFRVLLSSKSFLEYFGFDSNLTPSEKLKQAARLVFEDQYGELDYLMGDQPAVTLVSQRNVEEMKAALEDGEFFEELKAQARIVATVLGIPQALVRVNCIRVGEKYLFEINARRPRIRMALVGTSDELVQRSYPVRGKLKAYLKGRLARRAEERLREGSESVLSGWVPKVVGD